jgi:hypothetical protein
MEYTDKYIKYKMKYLDIKSHINKQNGSGKKDIQFILFGDVMTGHQTWYYNKDKKDINFVAKLEELGDVIILKPNYVNFMNLSKEKKSLNWFYKSKIKNNNFAIEDLQFENYSEWVYKQIDKKKKFIAIGLDQGCHFAKFFCNQYPDNCICLYVLIDRNFTKKSFEKTFKSDTNYNFIKSIVGDDYQNYMTENLTNEIIDDLLNKITNLENNERYIELLNGICKGIIRSQYDKIKKMDIKTIIYSDAKTLSQDKIDENIKFNEKSDDKIIYYYVIDDSEYLIHGKYADEILNNIYGLLGNEL